MRVRRVVTGHKSNGEATVAIDDFPDALTFRAGATVWNVWSTPLPAENDSAEDGAKRIIGTVMSDSAVFRVIEYAPGVAPRNHRTASIDFAIVLSGQIEMHLDGEVVCMQSGDALVQRGTIHNWVNRGDKPCVIAFVLIAARPAQTSGQQLRPTG